MIFGAPNLDPHDGGRPTTRVARQGDLCAADGVRVPLPEQAPERLMSLLSLSIKFVHIDDYKIRLFVKSCG